MCPITTSCSTSWYYSSIFFCCSVFINYTTSTPALTAPRSRQAPPKKKSKNTTATPENVHIEYLNQEINIAKTKATSLESQIRDKEEKIGILEDRLKAIEEPRLSNLFGQDLSPQSQSQTPPGQPPVHPQVHHCPWTATLTKKVFTELSFFKSQVTSLQKLVVTTIIPNASAPSPTPTQSAQLIPQPYHQPLVFLIRLSRLLLLTQKVHHLPLEEVLPHHQPQHSLSSLNPQLEQPLLIQMLHHLLQTILAEKVPRHLSLLQEHPQDKPPQCQDHFLIPKYPLSFQESQRPAMVGIASS